MKTPAIALTFANDQDDHLALLKEESNQLFWTLHELDAKGAIEVVREESADVDSIVRIFQEYDQQIAIFHYGGHAGGHGLRLEAGEAHAEGLAELFHQQADNLKLVFLNGCSTKPQVDRLLSLGVKAVIATAAPIHDPTAKEFAEYFYKWLVARQSIKGAFESAAAAIRTKHDSIQKPVIELRATRGIVLRDQQHNDFPWGLYVNEEHQDILDWCLPKTPASRKYVHQQDDFRPNQYLKYVLDAMLFLDDGLREKLCNKDGRLLSPDGNPLNDQQKFYLILQHLPWLIGAPFQKLIALKEPNLERLKQIASTYLIASQTLMYIIVAQLWNKPGLTSKQKANLLDCIEVTREEFLVFDYLGYVKKLHLFAYFDAENPPLVKEVIPFLEELSDRDSELFEAYLYLEALRDKLQGGKHITEEEAPAFCQEAESSLTVLLSRIAFLVSYSMIAVRDIEILSYPHTEPEYRHRLGVLNGIGDTLGVSHRLIKQYTSCDSVILVEQLDDLDDPDRLEQAVNLSPLVIDINSFQRYATDTLNVHMFAYREGDYYYYYKMNGNLFNIQDDQSKLLAITAKEEPETEDKTLDKFLPLRQSAFLADQGEAAQLINRPKLENPYCKIVEQFEIIIASLTAG